MIKRRINVYIDAFLFFNFLKNALRAQILRRQSCSKARTLQFNQQRQELPLKQLWRESVRWTLLLRMLS